MSDEHLESRSSFYLGRDYDLSSGQRGTTPLTLDSADLTTHAVCVGMTGSGKTGLCLCLLEEAILDGIPAVLIDPKGDLGNLLLTFPELRGDDFAPWVDPAAARQAGVEKEEFADQQAGLWRRGLADWGIDGQRLRRLREAARIRIYTPGSSAGLPVSILSSLAAPDAATVEDGDLLRDRIAATVTSLLGLLGIDADPVQSREHILLSQLFGTAWREGRDLGLAELVPAIRRPPFDRVGVLGLEAFYPEADRFRLAMAVNGLLAAPGFQSWLEGEPLDIERLLHGPGGEPQVAIFSIAHLGDAERMFFVALLAQEMLAWARRQPGTERLRALLYFDEVFGFLPPTAEPPSKRPLLTLLKQARAHGLGLLLATQNPVDLDYKALSNTGTWLLGRLQTERDKARVLDGLEGAAATARGFQRSEMEATLAALGKRVFLLHSVHRPAPEVFQVRWAMSYLRGPLTRQHIEELMRPLRGAVPADSTGPAATAAPATTGTSGAGTAAPPVIAPGIEQIYLEGPAGGAAESYRSGVAARVRLYLADRGRKHEAREELRFFAPFEPQGRVVLDWAEAVELGPEIVEGSEPRDGLDFGVLPAEASRNESYRDWSRDLASWLYSARRIRLHRHRELQLVQEVGESEVDFLERLDRASSGALADRRAELQTRQQKARTQIEGRIAKARAAVDQQAQQVAHAKRNVLIHAGEALIGLVLGGSRRRSASAAVRGYSRVGTERADVAAAEVRLQELERELEALTATQETALRELEAWPEQQRNLLDTVELTPRKADIDVQWIGLAWWAAGEPGQT